MKRLLLPILIGLVLPLAGCGGRQTVLPETDPAPVATEKPAAEEPELSPGELDRREQEELAALEAARLQKILDGMSVEEKVGQLFFARCPEADAAEKIAQYHLGGVLLFTRDYKDANGNWLTRDAFADQLASFQGAASNDTGIPLFVGSDEEGGTVTRASRNPNLFDKKFRSPQQVRAERSEHGDCFAEDAREKNVALRALGVNVNFAPVCDVSTNPNDFIYDRTLGQDAEATAAFVDATVRTMGEAGVGAVLKHFPGYGNNADTHTGVAVDERPYEQFETSDFLPFRAGVEAGAPFVLVSHNIVTCLDDTLPASLSPVWHGVLREELGFDGVILTDDLAMDAVKAYAEDGSAAVLAILAGSDMVVTSDFETQIPQALAAVEDGRISGKMLDAAVARVLRAKLQLGLLGK